MKFSLRISLLLTAISLFASSGLHGKSTPQPTAESKSTIPFAQLGIKAQEQYTGDGISITPTRTGAHLRAVMQDLEGEATTEGLWLRSATDDEVAAGKGVRFRVRAEEMGRGDDLSPLMERGVVRADSQGTAFVRPGVVEEYSVSTDGVRQDFVVAERPAGRGKLTVSLGVTGARAEVASFGVRLVLLGNGREIAYSRLRVTDAFGRELHAGMEVEAPGHITVRVEDGRAVYPVRIDPTFSDADWVSLNPGIPGANNSITAMVADGAGNVYVGGNFTFIGTVEVNHIAKWDGSTWSSLGSGVAVSNSVRALAVSGSDLYVGGKFDHVGGIEANNVAKWDGVAWSAFGAGLGEVSALAVMGSDLYVGADFATAGGGMANQHIAKWNGSSWSALGSGMNNSVNALAVSGTDLYAGGAFTTAGGVADTKYLAKWDGADWSALGSGMDNIVNALVIRGSDLYAGGIFSKAGGIDANRIAKWDGISWAALGSGMNNSVDALAVSGSDLYAGGYFATAGGVAASRIAKWDGTSWSSLGSGLSGGNGFLRVSALAVSGSELFVGGEFSSADGIAANHIAKWDGSGWAAFGPAMGMNGNVYALAVGDTELFVGGNFTVAGGAPANRIAKWDGSTWSALGSGLDGYVSALAVAGTDLYAGGSFTMAGGVTANRIAKWDGTSWSALGSGMNNIVKAVVVSDGTVYAGGMFTLAGGVTANGIAKWDGSAWSAFGSGMIGGFGVVVNVLAVSGGDLYAGGARFQAGRSVAKWNGTSWSALGSGIFGGVVTALAVSGSDLYVGGLFGSPDGTTDSANLAKWDGSAWSSLSTGSMSGSVSALAVSRGGLYVGGTFSMIGGIDARNIARWDGTRWSAVGSGANTTVAALAADHRGQLFVGGFFGLAGSMASPFVAKVVFPYASFQIGDTVNLTLDFLKLEAGETIRILGLPPGLTFTAGNPPTITGTALGPTPISGMKIQVLDGKQVVRSIAYDLAVAPYPFAGSYEVLLEESGLPTGKLKVTVSSPSIRVPNPVYTANLERVGEPPRSAKGSFAAGGGSTQILPIIFNEFKGYPTIRFDLSASASGDLVSGVTVPASATSARGLRLATPVQTPGGNPRLTLTLPPASPGDRITTPGGVGYAKGSVSSKALVSLSGQLGDAQTFTARLNLSRTNQAVVWLTPYKDKSSFVGGIIDMGDLGVATRSASSDRATEGLQWKRQPDATATSYSDGFGPLTLGATPSRWVNVAKASTLADTLGLVDRALDVSFIAPTADIMPARLSLRDNFTLLRILPNDAVPFTASAIGSTGTFTGNLILPTPGARSAINGVLLQDDLFGTLLGQGLVKIPIAGGVRGSFQTAGIELQRASSGIGDRKIIGEVINDDISRYLLAPGETLKVVGLPAGLTFTAGPPPNISGTIRGIVSSQGITIQVLTGRTIVRTYAYDLDTIPYRFAASYEVLLEDAGWPVGKLRFDGTGPTASSPNAAFTATLERLGELRRSTKGTFTDSGVAQQSVQVVFPAYKTYPAVAYDIVFSSTASIVGGCSTVPASSVTGRGFRMAKTARIPVGNPLLTMSFPPTSSNYYTGPGGIGWAKGRVTTKGLALISGMLGDGKDFTASLSLSATNQAIVWLTPYKMKASYFGGIIDLGDLGAADRGADAVFATTGLKWWRLPDTTEVSYPAGFITQFFTAKASRWFQPSNAEALAQSLGLDFRAFTATYTTPSHEVLPDRLSQQDHLSLRDNYTWLHITPVSVTPFTGRAFSTNGTFVGNLTLPAPAAKSAVLGVFLQDQSFGKVIGQGLVKVPITGTVKGAFRTIGVTLGN